MKIEKIFCILRPTFFDSFLFSPQLTGIFMFPLEETSTVHIRSHKEHLHLLPYSYFQVWYAWDPISNMKRLWKSRPYINFATRISKWRNRTIKGDVPFIVHYVLHYLVIQYYIAMLLKAQWCCLCFYQMKRELRSLSSIQWGQDCSPEIT